MTQRPAFHSGTFRALLIAACLAASAPAAAEWAAYFQGPRSNHYYNPQTLRHGGDMRWVNELTNLTSPDADGTRSIVTELEIDCANAQFRVKAQTRYRKSKAKGAASRTPGVGGSTALSPNTAIDALAGRVCG